MNKSISLILLLLLAHLADAFTLNKKIRSGADGVYMAPGSAALVNDQLFYWQAFYALGGTPAFYVRDLETHSVTQLTTGQFSHLNENQVYLKRDGDLLFLNNEYGLNQLWRTDGSPEGTLPVHDLEVSSKVRTSHGYMYFTEASAGKLIVSDGMTYQTHEIFNLNNAQGNPVCAFSTDHIVANVSDNNNGPYLRSNNGIITALNINLPQNHTDFVLSFISHKGACYTFYPSINGGTEVWKFTADGSSEPLNDVLGSDPITGLLSHDGRLYVRQSNDQGIGFTIKRLSEDELSVDATYTDPNDETTLAITAWSSVGEYIAIQTTTPTASPAINSLQLLRSSLPEYPYQDRPFPAKTPTAHQTAQGLLFANYTYQPNGLVTTQLLLNGGERYLSLPLGRDTEIVTDPASDKLVVIAENNVYQIEDVPDIGSIVTGGWHDPNIKNQGLNIFKGQRTSGTEYVSVTGYTFWEGEPFWFAGVAELTTPTRTLTVELLRFSGPGLFEANHTPDQLPFAEVELTMLTCNKISASLVTSEQSFELALHRLDDRTFNQTCQIPD